MDSETIHLAELRIAKTIGDPRRVMPLVPENCRRILDLGCGAGQTLIASNLHSRVSAYGVDSDLAALQLGRQLTARVQFICARGECLPFKSNYFDLVISRVALPYMQIPTTLTEIRRVLEPAGRLWIVLHPYTMVVRELVDTLLALQLKAVLGRLYVVGNGLAFHLFGKVFRRPFSRRLYESFQTVRGIRRGLRTGFDEVEVTRERFFVVTARKA